MSKLFSFLLLVLHQNELPSCFGLELLGLGLGLGLGLVSQESQEG
jgi:hypothetical protein